MYAFSGYSIYNIFFNHFHEVIAFFPLLLIAMEEYFVDGRRGLSRWRWGFWPSSTTTSSSAK